MARSAAQKRATRKLVALNKRNVKEPLKEWYAKRLAEHLKSVNRQKPSVNRQVQIEEHQSEVWQDEDVPA